MGELADLAGWFLGRDCALCGRAGPTLCGNCRWQLPAAGVVPPMPPLRAVDALVRYERRGRDLVTALKYRNRRGLVDELGRAMAERAPTDADLVTWVPTTGRRRRARGYDQAELLAGAVGRALDRPCPTLLRRLDARPQTGRGRRARLTGPVITSIRPAGGVVVLVDDVVTTGSSLRAGAVALLAAGASDVVGLTLAQTPDLHRGQSGPARR